MASARAFYMSFDNLMMIYYKSVRGPSWGFCRAALPGGVYGLFAGRLFLRGYMFMQAIKGACVACCAACVASCGVPCIYGLVACSVGFPGAFVAFRGYGPRVMLSAFCAAFKGAAGPPEYINQWPQLPCILGAFWGRLRAFRASAGICSGFP